MKTAVFKIENQHLELHPFRAAYWHEESVLFIADTHFGKIAHFRNHGIAIPENMLDHSLDRLNELMLAFSPESVVILGDFFHSKTNNEIERLYFFLKQHTTFQFKLVPGNHDRHSMTDLKNLPIQITPKTVNIYPFILSHHPLEEIPEGWYNLCGHLHPCAKLKGPGRQSLKLPCFHFNHNQGILPAFDISSGRTAYRTTKNSEVFVITDNSVLKF